MNAYTPNRQIDNRLGAGLLSFPVTHFNDDLTFNEGAYREHISWMIGSAPAGLFAAGGTGEFFSLSPSEVEVVTRAAVSETAGRVPVIGGVGYGTALAIEMARAAERAGADGILVLPPYLIHSEPAGMAAHLEAICRATGLSVFVYSRDNAIIGDEVMARLCERCPNLVGYKDGVGDIELMVRVRTRMRDRLIYVGGLPTAETFALPYLEMGVTTYSSAIFNFLPKFAMDFYAAVRRRDHAAVDQALQNFVLPYIEIRNRARGYPVSIVKAGMTLIGRHAGPVRTPLCDLNEGDLDDLRKLMEAHTNVIPPATAVIA